MATQYFYNTGSSSLGAGQSIQWWWWFSTAPTLIVIVPIAEAANTPLQCSTPQVQRNADGTVTYFVDVANTGNGTVDYHLTADLIVR
jgi:hypothetical protein